MAQRYVAVVTVVLAGLAAQASADDTLAASSAPYAYLVAASAHTTGLYETLWLSDLVLHNPGGDEASGRLFFLRTGQDNSAAEGIPFTVAGGASLRLDDVVGTVFAQTKASGGIMVASDAPLVVTSRTFNDDAAGTYGQYIEGYTTLTALADGDEARLIHLSQNAISRTNLGIVNASSTGFHADVTLLRGDGTVVGSKRYWIAPFKHYQEVEIFAKVSAGDVDDGTIVVSSDTAGARYFVYASVADNRTGDPMQVVPMPSSAGEAIYLPGAAHVPGYGGAVWRTDLEVHNPGTEPAEFAVELLRRGAANASPAEAGPYTLDGGHSMRLGDVLATAFGTDGAAALRLTPRLGRIMAVQRTYNLQPGGTYGQFVGGMPASTAFRDGQEARLVQLSQAASDTEGFRTNLGLVNASETAVVVDVDLFDGDGALLGSRSYTLPAYGYIQEDKVFRTVTAAAVDDGYAVLTTPTAGGRFFAYASVADNRSGDPITVPARTVGTAAGDEITITLPGGVPLTLVRIAAGTFTMGSPSDEAGRSSVEGPQHEVTLTRDYYVGKTEVTQQQWQAVMGSNPSSSYGVGDEYPVYRVSWDDICGGTEGDACTASSFIGKLNSHLGTTKLRLPTEAEWEYAARAGTTGPFSFDTSANPTWDTSCGSFPEAEAYMWWCGNAFWSSMPVGQKDPNPWGLYDMHGNVWEWVADWYDTYPSSAVTDPTGPLTTSRRVARGGSWIGAAKYCRSATRNYATPDYIDDVLGFRLAMSPPETAPCSYSLSPTGRSHGAAPATGTFSVTAAGGCRWTATSDVGWVVVTSGSSGNGDGSVGYSVSANPSGGQRTGTITVAEQVFTVTQSGGPDDEITITLPGGWPLTLVRIAAGTFVMGSPIDERGRGPETQHQVTLTQDYYIGKYEVTQLQWADVMGSNPSTFSACGLDCPVENVSWDDVCGGDTGSSCTASSFIGRLNAHLGTTKLRLPTEAEWEYAARAGTTEPFSFDTSANPDWDTSCGSFPAAEAYMWWCGNASATHPVGERPANPWGLYDMHGNVNEWVADWLEEYPATAVTDPTGPSTGSVRALRGGSWNSYARWCRSASRSSTMPSFRISHLGFRLAMSP